MEELLHYLRLDMVVYPMIHRISYMSGGFLAGFQPSTVSSSVDPDPPPKLEKRNPLGWNPQRDFAPCSRPPAAPWLQRGGRVYAPTRVTKPMNVWCFFFRDFWIFGFLDAFFFDRFSEISHGFLRFFHSFLFSFVPFFVSYFWAFCCFHFHVEIIATTYFLLAFLDFNSFQLRTLLFQRHSVFFPFQFHPQTSPSNRWITHHFKLLRVLLNNPPKKGTFITTCPAPLPYHFRWDTPTHDLSWAAMASISIRAVVFEPQIMLGDF